MKLSFGFALGSAALVLTGCQLTVSPVGPPAVEVVAPAPVVEVAPPEVYVWDGYENVGMVNGEIMILNPGGVWIVADPFIVERFHGWERYHSDWRLHAIRNERYRRVERHEVHREVEHRDAQHAAPQHAPARKAPQKEKKKDDNH